jgi:hypothetical protein
VAAAAVEEFSTILWGGFAVENDDIRAIRSLIDAHFNGLRWTPGTRPDWAAFSADFLPDASLFPAARPARRQTLDAFIARMNGVAQGSSAHFNKASSTGTGSAPVREAILGLRWNLIAHDASYDSLSFQLAQLLAEHLLRDRWNDAFQVRESQDLAAEEMEHFRAFSE